MCCARRHNEVDLARGTLLRAGLGGTAQGDAGRFRRHPCRPDAPAARPVRRRLRAAVRRRHDRPSDGHRRRAPPPTASRSRRWSRRATKAATSRAKARRSSTHAARWCTPLRAGARHLEGRHVRLRVAPTRPITPSRRPRGLTGERDANHPGNILVPARPDRRRRSARRSTTRSSQGWACAVEYTDDPHPRNTFWEMCGRADVRPEGRRRRPARQSSRVAAAHPERYVKVNAFDSTRGFETTRLSFIVQRPATRAGLRPRRAPRARAARSATRCAVRRSTGRWRPLRRGRDGDARRTDARRPPPVALDALYRESNVGDIARRARPRAGRARAGEAPAPRDRRVLLVSNGARAARAFDRRAVPAHVASPAIRAPARRRSRCAWPRSSTPGLRAQRAIWWR